MPSRTLSASAFVFCALSAVAAQPPRTMPAPVPPAATNEDAEPSVCFETRIVKVPVGFCERVGLKADIVSLSDAQLRKFLEVAQENRTTSVLQAPKITAASGQAAQVRICETHDFVTSIEVMRVKGDPVFIPKSKSIELGDNLAITGTLSADGKYVRVEGQFTRVRVEGAVELIPVTTQITPVFEGGSRGKPIPFTQFLQAPDVRTEKVEKTATVPTGTTLVLGGWKETEPAAPPAKGLFKRESKEKPAEYEVVVLVSVRALR